MSVMEEEPVYNFAIYGPYESSSHDTGGPQAFTSLDLITVHVKMQLADRSKKVTYFDSLLGTDS